MFEDVGSASTSSSNNSSSSNADRLKKGPWTAAEDTVLMAYVREHGEGNWNHVHKYSGLARCGKSCRLRWANHLRPNLKKGAFTPDEERLIIHLHSSLGNKWARMASMMPGRTDNEIKNYWNTRIKRRLRAGLSIYPPDLGQPNSLGEMNIKLSGQSSFGKSLMQNNVPLNNNPEQESMDMKSTSEGSKHKTVNACELPSSQRDTKNCKEASSRMSRMGDSRVYQAREIDKREFAELDAVVPNAMNMNSSVWAHDSRHDTLDFCVFYAAHNMPSLKSSGIKLENRILRNPECPEEDIGTLIEFTKPCEEQQHNNIPAADWYSSSPLVRNYDAIHLYDTAAPQNDVRIGADSTPMMQNSQYYYHAACDVLESFPWTNMHAASE